MSVTKGYNRNAVDYENCAKATCLSPDLRKTCVYVACNIPQYVHIDRARLQVYSALRDKETYSLQRKTKSSELENVIRLQVRRNAPYEVRLARTEDRKTAIYSFAKKVRSGHVHIPVSLSFSPC